MNGVTIFFDFTLYHRIDMSHLLFYFIPKFLLLLIPRFLTNEEDVFNRKKQNKNLDFVRLRRINVHSLYK